MTRTAKGFQHSGGKIRGLLHGGEEFLGPGLEDMCQAIGDVLREIRRRPVPVEGALVVVLLVETEAPRIFIRLLSGIEAAARLLARAFLELADVLFRFLFGTRFHAEMNNQYKHS